MACSFDIVIVGGGQAGRRAAEGARAASPQATIAIVGEEPDLPYDRPPLSKEALADFSSVARTEIRSAAWYSENRIETILDTRVLGIDLERRKVETLGGAIGFAALIFATGSRPRGVELGVDADRVHTIRTRADAERLSERLLPGRRIGVVGAGFIGLEVAAAAIRRGCEVEVFEAAPHSMARVLPEFLARLVERRHIQAGVRLHFEAPADPGRLERFEEIVAGVGIIPNVELAEACGVACNNGIVVDAYGRTNIPNIYAAGEVTYHPSRAGFAAARRESWQVAEHQAFAAGSTAAGVPKAYAEIPWFWSDQHDLNIQVLGELPGDADWLVRGEQDSGSFSAFALRDGSVRGVVAFNMGRDIAAARRLMSRELKPPTELLADARLGWNEILKAAA